MADFPGRLRHGPWRRGIPTSILIFRPIPDLYNYFPWDAYTKYNAEHKVLFASDNPLSGFRETLDALDACDISAGVQGKDQGGKRRAAPVSDRIIRAVTRKGRLRRNRGGDAEYPRPLYVCSLPAEAGSRQLIRASNPCQSIFSCSDIGSSMPFFFEGRLSAR